jgi:hypothetical protein
METKYIKSLFLFLILASIYSCGKNSCPLSSGSNFRESRYVSPFSEIILFDKINLILTEDSTETVSVEAGKNLLAGIQTAVENNVLTIKDQNHCGALRDPADQTNVYISTNHLQKITYYGAGNIRSTNTLQASQFTIDSWIGIGSVRLSLLANQTNAIVRNNNADISLTGQSQFVYIYCADVGSVNLLDFTCASVNIDSRTIKDIFVNVTDSINAHILYKGNVYYKGNPPIVHTVIVNSGRLIHLP